MAGWDPAGVLAAVDAAAEAANDERLRTEMHGQVIMEAALEKAAPELFTELVFAGAKGSGVHGGGLRPIYKMKKKNGEVVGLVDEEGNPIETAEKATEGLAKKGEQTFKRSEFGWRKLYHALQSPIYQGAQQGSFFMEVPFSPTTLRLYTDHRVMGTIVIPGVSHVALMAATGLQGFGAMQPMAKDSDHASVKEVLFERPYVIHEGLEIIHGPADQLPQETVYCRSSAVSRESGPIKAAFS